MRVVVFSCSGHKFSQCEEASCGQLLWQRPVLVDPEVSFGQHTTPATHVYVMACDREVLLDAES